jgi:hypothetical protein
MGGDGVRVVVDYSAGLTEDQYPEVLVVPADPARVRHGDAPPKAAYHAAFLQALEGAPKKVLCLTGPYGYAMAYSAAVTARRDLLPRGPELMEAVQVLNVGRSFLGLGALSLAAARSGLDLDALDRWIDDATPATHTWLVARTETLAGLAPEHRLERTEPLPDARFTLLRLRLSAKVSGGFADAGSALRAAVERSAVPAGGVVLFGAGLGFTARAIGAPAGATVHEVATPPYLPHAFGECAALGVAPGPPARTPAK